MSNRKFTSAKICTKCNGSGLIPKNGTLVVCSACNGTGLGK